MSSAEYESKIKNDPIELLKAIRKLSINAQDTKYQASIVADAMRTFLGCRQKEGESLQDYTRRFKTTREVMTAQIGNPIPLDVLRRSLSQWSDTDDAKQQECDEEVWGCFTAYVFLENSDKAKYGTVVKNLSSQFSLGNDQYPKSITSANHVLSNHPHDNSRQK